MSRKKIKLESDDQGQNKMLRIAILKHTPNAEGAFVLFTIEANDPSESSYYLQNRFVFYFTLDQ